MGVLNQVQEGNSVNPPPASPPPSLNQEPAVTAPVVPAGESVDFKSTLPDDIKADPSLAVFKNVEDLAKSYIHTKSLVGAETVKKISKHHTPQERAKFLQEVLSLPTEEADYDVKAVEGLDENVFNELKKVAFENSIPADVFKSLVEKYGELNQSYMSNVQSTMEEKQKEEWAVLQTKYGKALDDKMRIARMAIKELAGEDIDMAAVEKEMNDRGWGNAPQLAELFVRMGESMFKEDVIKGKIKGSISLAPGEAQERVNSILGDLSHPYHKNDHPNHKAAIEEVQKLYAFVAAAEETQD